MSDEELSEDGWKISRNFQTDDGAGGEDLSVVVRWIEAAG
jgi:hypothetical protein